MAETIKVNFALQPETVEGMERLCKATYRSKSDLIDFLVAKEIEKLVIVARPPEALQPSEQGG